MNRPYIRLTEKKTHFMHTLREMTVKLGGSASAKTWAIIGEPKPWGLPRHIFTGADFSQGTLGRK